MFVLEEELEKVVYIPFYRPLLKLDRDLQVGQAHASLEHVPIRLFLVKLPVVY